MVSCSDQSLYLCSTPPYLLQSANDRRMHEYTQLAFGGQVQKARAVCESLDPVRKALEMTRPAGKAAAHQKYWQELLGQAGGPVRRPRAAFQSCGLRARADGRRPLPG